MSFHVNMGEGSQVGILNQDVLKHAHAVDMLGFAAFGTFKGLARQMGWSSTFRCALSLALYICIYIYAHTCMYTCMYSFMYVCMHASCVT